MGKTILKTIIITAAGALLGLALSNKFIRTAKIQKEIAQKEQAKEAAPQAALAPKVSSQKFQEIIRENRATSLSDEIKEKLKSDAEAEACLRAYEPLLSAVPGDDLKLENLPKNIAPCALESEAMKGVRAEFERVCDAKEFTKNKTRDELEKANLTCASAFVLFRALANAWLNRDQNVEEISDLKLLVDNMLASVSEGNVDQFEKVAERMVELAPEMYEALKAKMIANVMRAANEDEDSREFADAMVMLDRDLKRVLESDQGTDPELQEAVILARSRMLNDFDRMENTLNEFRQAGKWTPVLEYYQASLFWKRGQHKEAIERVQELAKKYPDVERYQETLKALLADPEGKADGHYFSSRLSVNFKLTNQ